MKGLTLSILKGKTWYRLVKVVYIGFFVIILMLVWGIVKNNDFWTDGNYDFSNCITYQTMYENKELEEANSICMYSHEQYNKEFLAQLGKFIVDMMIGFGLTMIFFEVFRRIFYYIILGTFFPKKINK